MRTLAALLLLAAPSFGQDARVVLTWGSPGDKDGEFHSPIGIAINRKDEVYVTDLNNARVQKFSADGRRLGGFDLPWDNPKKRSSLVGGIALDGNGLIYLSFMIQHRVAVYGDDGKVVREWGKLGKEDGEFNQPGGVLLAADGAVYVTDQCNHRVQKFSPEGKFLGKWGGYGAEAGKFGAPDKEGSRFAGPHFLALDSKARFYTTEGVAGRVQQLGGEGRPLLAWGSKGSEPGGFGSFQTPYGKGTFGPIGVIVDPKDRVWVSSLNDRVQCFTPEGKFLFGIGGTGKEPGKFARPHGMAVDSKGFFYVVDAGNQRIQKFELPEF